MSTVALPDYATNRIIEVAKVIRMARSLTNEFLKHTSVQVQFDQLPVLLCLYANGTLYQQELAVILLRDKSSVLRSVRALHAKGLIAIMGDGDDGRKKRLLLTAEGRMLAMKTLEFLPAFERVWSALNEDISLA